MLLLRRFSVCAITAVVLFFGGQLVYAVTLGSQDSNSSSCAFTEYLQVWRESSEVEALQEKQDARRNMMVAIAREVIARRLSVAEGIEQYRSFYPDGVDQLMVGRNDDERLGLCLIRWVKVELSDFPSQSATLLPELEKELERHLQRVENGQQATTAVHSQRSWDELEELDK